MSDSAKWRESGQKRRDVGHDGERRGMSSSCRGPIACRLSFVVPAILCGRCSSSPISHHRHCSRSADRVVCRPPIPIIRHSPSPSLSFIYPRPSHSLPLVLVLESSYCRTLSHTSSSTRGAGRNAAVGRVASVGLYHIEVRT